jgi:ADP-heptose:LPS heptosyltransferase
MRCLSGEKLFKQVFRYPRVVVLACFDSLSILDFRFHRYDWSNLLIVRVDNIGDFILWLPSAKKLNSPYSEYEKSILICNHTCSELALATGLFSEVIGVDLVRFTRDLGYRFRMLRRVAHLGASVAIQPTYSRVFLTGDSLVRASGAKTRIGFDGDLSNIPPWQKLISDRWYTKLVPASASPMMELGRNAEFLRNLGIGEGHASLPLLPKLVELPAEKRISDDYFVVFPGASSPARIWPAESFVKVARQIVDEYGFIPVICGGETEQKMGERILLQIGDERGKNHAGKTSLPELAEIIREAQLVVSNETSAIHISAAVSTPSVCILGGGHYGRFIPYPEDLEGIKPTSVINKMNCFGCNWRCQFAYDPSVSYPCVEEISIQQVMNAVHLAMKQSPISNGNCA